MADGVLVTNRDLEVVLTNPALMRLLELDLTTPAGQPGALSDYFPRETVVQGLKALLHKGGSENELISQELSKGRRHLRALSASISGPQQQTLGTVTVVHDITTFKELDEMKSNFVHMVSHELRSPLATIKQQQTVILDGIAGELTEKQRDAVESIAA